MAREYEKKRAMGLSDCCAATFGERFHHYLDQYAGKDPLMRAQMADTAHKAAEVEMLDEIHTMLRELLKRAGKEFG